MRAESEYLGGKQENGYLVGNPASLARAAGRREAAAKNKALSEAAPPVADQMRANFRAFP